MNDKRQITECTFFGNLLALIDNVYFWLSTSFALCFVLRLCVHWFDPAADYRLIRGMHSANFYRPTRISVGLDYHLFGLYWRFT